MYCSVLMDHVIFLSRWTKGGQLCSVLWRKRDQNLKTKTVTIELNTKTTELESRTKNSRIENRPTIPVFVIKTSKPSMALNGKPIAEPQSVTCHMGSHSVTCHPTQVNAPHHNSSQAGRYSIYPPWKYGRLSSLIVARPGIKPTTAWSQVRRPNHYATESPYNPHFLKQLAVKFQVARGRCVN